MSGLLSYHYHDAWAAGPQENSTDAENISPSKFFAQFDSPWKSYNTQSQSSSLRIQHAIKFAHFLWKYDPTYQQAIQRVVSYFLTDIEFFDPTYQGTLKDEDIRGYRELLENQLNLKHVLQQLLLNYCVYGNVIVSLLPPLRRMLQCPSCAMIHPIGVITSPENKVFNFKYHVSSVRFEATCSVCGKRSFWRVSDVKDDFHRNARVSIYDLRHFIIQCDPFTDKRVYTWYIPPWIKRSIEQNDSLTLASAPMSILQAISKDKCYTFNSDTVLHLREPDLVGMQTGGWGIPQAMYCYGASRYMFNLRKMNEILTEDYLLPLRLISPRQEKMANPAVGIGPSHDLADFNRHVRAAVSGHRKDPGVISTIPFPIEYQVAGTPGNELVSHELLLQGEDMQLNAIGVPPQLYRGDLNLQTAPMAARLFESHWQHMVEAANTFLRWVSRKVADELGWKPLGLRLARPKIADNMDQLMLMMQLMPQGKISDQSVLQRLGLEAAEERRRRTDDEIQEIERDLEVQTEADKRVAGTSAMRQAVDEQRAMASGGGQMPQAGAPPAEGSAVPPAADPVAEIMARIEAFGNPDTPAPITEQYQVAQEAAAIFAFLPEVEKRAKLREVDHINKPLADLIRSQMDEVHAQHKQQAQAHGEQMMQQQGGAPPQ